MGMYCWCGCRRNTKDENGETIWDADCTCDLTGFVKCSDQLPTEDGVYEVRVQSNSADIYQEEAQFSVNPKIGGYNGPYCTNEHESHWAYPYDSWDSDIIFMWRPLVIHETADNHE